MTLHTDRRGLLLAGGALIVSFGLPRGAAAQRAPTPTAGLGKTVAADQLDGYFAVGADGGVTLYCGKVDLGTGLRIAIPQMAAEELGVPVTRIAIIEGDTALTPDQGPTAGSTGIMRGGVQIRQAAATARQALIAMAAERLGRSAADLDIADGEVRAKTGDQRVGFGALIGDKRFNLKIDDKAPLKKPADYRIVGQPLPRPDVPAKVSGRHVYMHDLKVPGMVHARVIRTPTVGAELLEVDTASVKSIPGVQIVRIKDFLAVVAADEWDAISAAKVIKARWSQSAPLVGHDGVRDWMTRAPKDGDETLVKKGEVAAKLAGTAKLSGTYYWPVQSHASMGPSCGIADVKDGVATIWSASQATHRLRGICAKFLGLDPTKVRVIYLDGAGCYGMNGHDDVCADAALISKAIGKPVRVQWSREDELGWDPKGPPQLLSIDAALDDQGKIGAWRTEMWLPKATAGLPNIPLLGPDAAGLPQVQGLSTGLISQNAHPPYALPNVEVLVHWLKDAPLRPSNIRAPGKVANTFAVESMVDELAVAAKRDTTAFRLDGLSDPRGIEVLKRTAALIGWDSRLSPKPGGGLGRGMAYVHYKFNETYVAMAMEAEVDRTSGAIRVRRVACAHDCGLVINPDALRQQIEGNILQTLSRTLLEEVTFDQGRVTSTDWSSYPILTMPDVPKILIDVVNRPELPPLGAGEAAAAPVPAALANAIFDATGARLRTVPFTPERVKTALARGSA